MACQTRKTSHATRAAAKREAKRLMKLGSGHLTVFRCPVCQQFHIGNPPPQLMRGEISRDEISHHRWAKP